jgi:hypothetical protein
MAKAVSVQLTLSGLSKLAIAFLKYEEVRSAGFALTIDHYDRRAGISIDNLEISHDSARKLRRDSPSLID